MEDHKPDYIDEHQEWQRSQFIPGHYTQGKVPHYLKWPGSPLKLLLIFAFFDLVYIGIIIYTIMDFQNSENQTLSAINIAMLIVMTIFYFVLVISLYKKYKTLKAKRSV